MGDRITKGILQGYAFSFKINQLGLEFLNLFGKLAKPKIPKQASDPPFSIHQICHKRLGSANASCSDIPDFSQWPRK
jgi:hypothetical protein